MSPHSSADIDTDQLSAECAVAKQYGPKELHGDCRQKDIPLPHSGGVLLQTQCLCPCHPTGRPRKVRKP